MGPQVERHVVQTEVRLLRFVIEAELIRLAELERISEARVIVPRHEAADEGEWNGGARRPKPRHAAFVPPPREQRRHEARTRDQIGGTRGDREAEAETGGGKPKLASAFDMQALPHAAEHQH